MGSTVNQLLNEFGEKLVTDTRNKLRSKKVTFGGGQDSRLAARTTYDTLARGNGIALELYMPEEWYWVNSGRKPGPVSKEGRRNITEWVKKKAIVGDFINKNLMTRQKAQDERKAKLSAGNQRKFKKLKKLPFEKGAKALTYLVARGVTKHGYKATHFFDEVIKDGRYQKLERDLQEASKKDLVVSLKIN